MHQARGKTREDASVIFYKSKDISLVISSLTPLQPDSLPPGRVFLNSPSAAALPASRSLCPDFQFPLSGPRLAFSQNPQCGRTGGTHVLGATPECFRSTQSLCTISLSPRGLAAGLASLGWKY